MTELGHGRPGVELLLDFLEDAGVEVIFGNPGTLEQSFMAALSSRPGLSYMLALHETVAVAMADGYARAAGRIGFVNVHILPGLANALSQVYNAQKHRSPLVITAGQSQAHMLIQEPLLSADTVSIARQHTKWAWELRSSMDVVPALRRAFKVARSAPPGPVFLSLPLDLLDQLTSEPRDPRPAVRVMARSIPEPGAVMAAASAIRDARHPVILCGDDIGSARATTEATRLAETMGAEVFAVGQCEVGFPNNHPQFVRTLNVNAAGAGAHLEAADVVVVLGTPLFMQLIDPGEPILPPRAAVIHVDDSGVEAGKNIPSDFALNGDLGLAIDALNAALQDTMTASENDSAAGRRQELAANKAAQLHRLEGRIESARLDSRITPLGLMAALHDRVPADCVIVEEAPSEASALHQAFSFSTPGTLFGNRGGALGWGLPAALGVQVAMPGRAVVAILGDGAANYSIQGLWTAAHHRLPVKFVICNNRSYQILKSNLASYMPDLDISRLIGMDLVDPEIDFVSLARGYGVAARRVQDHAELGDALSATLQEPGPALIDVALGAAG
ncbi:MAG: benzoylformate decarboxylase [Chloroflexota bacterium]|jgi:benzoylformate decarboxylase|nr:benzoylformate decarboxylase [Chloroflexota bacterium]